MYEPKTYEPIKGLNVRSLIDPRVSERIRVLDRYCLPVRYTDNYYDKYVKEGLPQFNFVAFFHDILVGCITCRLENTAVEGEFKLYIMTITVLEPYRKLGIGSRLLSSVLESVHNDTHTRVTKVVLHMQVGSPAVEFYKRFHFEVVQEVKGYYTDLDEKTALYMQLVVPQPHFAASNGKK